MSVRKLVLLAVLGLALFVPAALAAQKGPTVDELVFNARMSEDIGVQDAAAGNTDLFYWGISGATFAGLNQATLDKLEVYTVPSGSDSLQFNPYPNAAPYIATVNGVDYFNPFAITQVRFAMNFLINRQYIVDNVLLGSGGWEATPETPGQPGTAQYNMIPTKLGITGTGDEAKGIQMITDAMTAAAAASKGRLVKASPFWLFDGKPVTIKFMIRVDDPNVRLPIGNYISDQIEKAGIKVDRLLWDRSKALAETRTDPKNYEWNIYTEGWGAGGTVKWWETNIAQMYAGWFGQMPGTNSAGYWQYGDSSADAKTINQLTTDVFQGNFVDANDYYAKLLQAQELGIKEGVRVFLCYQNVYYVANKARFNGRFVYGLGDGPNNWSMITADVKPGADGTKTLHGTEFSAQGALFMSSWDPVGAQGFSDVYSIVLAQQCTDLSVFTTPNSADTLPLRVSSWTNVQKKIDPATQNGLLDVPATAILWDHAKHAWAPVGAGVKSKMAATYSFTFGKYHDGTLITVADYLYALGFEYEWSYKDGDNDLRYDDNYASIETTTLDTIKGWVVNKDNTITVYYDYNYPQDPGREDSYGAPGLWVSSSGYPIGCSWPICEAIAQMVVTGVKNGGLPYILYEDPSGNTADVLRPSCVADIKAQLQKMVADKYVPDYIKAYTTADACVAAYQNAINWITAHGTAYISNGPFYIDSFDPTNNSMVEKAYRDPSYPYEVGYWAQFFKTTLLDVTQVTVPTTAKAGDDISVTVNVDQVLYPDNTSEPADKGTVSIKLETAAGELSYPATMTAPGVFTGTIKGADTASLPDGSYVIVGVAELTGAVPSSMNGNVVIHH